MIITLDTKGEKWPSRATVVIPFRKSSHYDLASLLGTYEVDSFKKIKRDLDNRRSPFQRLYTLKKGIQQIYLVRLEDGSGAAAWKKLFTEVALDFRGNEDTDLVLDLRAFEVDMKGSGLQPFAESAILGLYLGFYDIRLYKKEGRSTYQPPNLNLISFREKYFDISGLSDKMTAISASQYKMMDLVNAPANHKTPEMIANWTAAEVADLGIECIILDKSAIETLGMKALLAVNRGSANDPRCLILHHQGVGSDKKVALVGKGVCFDTGGLSIKGSQNMHYMKSDMGGAAAVIGTMMVAGRLKLPLDIMGIVPLTENSVDALSIKPGDVIGSLKGSTIEVIDTDAEGRLILADALSYVRQHFESDHLVDLATLTGSIVRALGTEAAGLMTHDDALAMELTRAGQETGERLWRMPLWKEYGDMMESDIADIKNLSDKPLAGSMTAAKFLEHFVDDHPSWAHLDIAGTAFGSNPLSKSYSATAFGVSLLSQWLMNLTTK